MFFSFFLSAASFSAAFFARAPAFALLFAAVGVGAGACERAIYFNLMVKGGLAC